MKVIHYKSNEGTRVGILVKTLRKYHYVLLIDNPIKITKLVIAEEQYFSDVMYRDKPYPITRALRHVKRMIREWNGGMKNVSKEVRNIF